MYKGVYAQYCANCAQHAEHLSQFATVPAIPDHHYRQSKLVASHPKDVVRISDTGCSCRQRSDSACSLFVGSSPCSYATQICPLETSEMVTAANPCKYTFGQAGDACICLSRIYSLRLEMSFRHHLNRGYVLEMHKGFSKFLTTGIA